MSIAIIPKFIALESKLNDIMAEEFVPGVQLLRSQKATLDADFVLQVADSRYQQLKAYRIPSEKVTELLDRIIQRGPDRAAEAQGLIRQLKDEVLQEAPPT